MTAENVLRISPEKKESAEHKFIFSGDVVRTGGEHPLATNAGHPRTGRRTRGRMMKGGGRVGELLPKRMRLETILVPTHGEVCVCVCLHGMTIMSTEVVMGATVFANRCIVVSNYCLSTVSILSQYCLNVVSVLSQYCINTVSVLSLYCQNTVTLM